MIIEVDLPLPWIVLCILQDSVVSVGVAQDAFTAAVSPFDRGETERNNEDGARNRQSSYNSCFFYHTSFYFTLIV